MNRSDTVGTHKTTISTDETGTHVCYHSTRVVSFNSNTVTLRSGGYHTNTTKIRMNQASQQFGLGFSVWQKDFAWFVDWKGKVLEFADGMVLL